MLEKYTDEYQVARNPYLYYKFLDLIKSINDEQVSNSEEIRIDLVNQIEILRAKDEVISKAAYNFMQESRISTKNRNENFSSLENSDESYDKYSSENFNYIVILSQIVHAVLNTYEDTLQMSKTLRIPSILTSKKRHTDFDTPESLQGILQEIQLNGHVLENYAKSLDTLLQNSDLATKIGNNIYNALESYYKMLLQRHSNGLKIFKDPVITDVAFRIFENVDSHGEIESGKSKDQVSAYTIRKAEVLAKVLKDDMVFKFVSDSNILDEFIYDTLTYLEKTLKKLVDIYEPQITMLYSMFNNVPKFTNNPVQRILEIIKDVNPANISYQESKNIKNESEKLIEKVQDETIDKIVYMLLDSKTSFQEVVQYILDRKSELRKFYHDENSFYVCKIGSGNSFKGEAPGALYIIPAEKPNGDIDKILGSNFDEVREFAQSIESASKWHDLFKATSPSKSADKANVLLVGPQGCGKTEVMRAIGADEKSISIFAQASDFETAWKGEADKNVKRLFESGLKLNRDSGKHVHFLIDEIDSVLNNDRNYSGKTNLTLEFQILMDGVVSYPNLSIWGATNNLEKIPIPMIRRFSKVLIVGELNQKERIKLLKMFLDRMPIDKNILDTRWDDWGYLLDGATGDIIRKVADSVWRNKMHNFVIKKPEAAETVLKQLYAEGPFSVEKFDREKFKNTLKPYITVSSIDIEKAIKETTSNVAISIEIATAVETYSKAKSFLDGFKN